MIARETTHLFKDQPTVAGLIGLSDTDMVLAAALSPPRHKRVFVTSGATSPRLPRQVPRYLFLACFGDNVQAAAGAEWAVKSLKARTAVVLYKQTSTYAKLLHRLFRDAVQATGRQGADGAALHARNDRARGEGTAEGRPGLFRRAAR